MYQITRGYKQGRAVMFYDIAAIDGSCARQLVPKDEVVKMCNDGEIGNAKIQWWEGKAIVRVANKNFPLVKLNSDGSIIATEHSIRTTTKEHRTTLVSNGVTTKSKVIGKINAKKASKADTKFDVSKLDYNTVEKNNLNGIKTFGELFDAIATDLKLSDIEKYKKEMSVKLDMDRSITSVGYESLAIIRSSMTSYIMNMVYEQINEAYAKWF